jgi:hypothetical protein
MKPGVAASFPCGSHAALMNLGGGLIYLKHSYSDWDFSLSKLEF